MAPITEEQQTKDAATHSAKIKALEKGLKRVRFHVGQPPYCAGETAGFPPEIAERLVKAMVTTENGRKRVASYCDETIVLKPRDDNEPAANA